MNSLFNIKNIIITEKQKCSNNIISLSMGSFPLETWYTDIYKTAIFKYPLIHFKLNPVFSPSFWKRGWGEGDGP